MKTPRQQIKKPCNNLFSKINALLIFAFIFFLPTQLGRHFFLPFSYLSGVRVDYLAPTVYVTDVLVFLLFVINLRYLRSVFRSRMLLFSLLLLLLPTIFAQSVPLAAYYYIKILEVVIVTAIANRHILKERALLVYFTITTIVQVALVILQFATKHSIQGVFYFLGERYMSLSTPGIAKASFEGIEFLRPYGTFSHPNSLAGFFLLLYVWVLTNNRFNKFLFLKYAVLFLSSILVFISFSKIAILSYVVLNGYYLFFRSRLSCRFCLIARAVILSVVGLVFFLAKTDPLTVQKRIELMQSSFRIITGHPVVGVGPGNYLVAQNLFASKFLYFFNQPVHNIFLLFFAETGFAVGGVLLIILFKKFRKLLLPGYILVIGAILCTGLFDHYWLTLQQNMLVAGFIIGSGLRLQD